MKKHISEFESYDELTEFFNNPVIQDEIKLREESMKKREWTKMLFVVLGEYIKTAEVLDLEIKWDEINGFYRLISYKR